MSLSVGSRNCACHLIICKLCDCTSDWVAHLIPTHTHTHTIYIYIYIYVYIYIYMAPHRPLSHNIDLFTNIQMEKDEDGFDLILFYRIRMHWVEIIFFVFMCGASFRIYQLGQWHCKELQCTLRDRNAQINFYNTAFIFTS